jgi:hypothetical protein
MGSWPVSQPSEWVPRLLPHREEELVKSRIDRPASRRFALLVASAAFIMPSAVVVPLSVADPASVSQVTMPAADPSPTGSASPTLGATQPSTATQQDDNDQNAADYTQVPLAVLAPLVLGLLVGGSLLIYVIRRARGRRT